VINKQTTKQTAPKGTAPKGKIAPKGTAPKGKRVGINTPLDEIPAPAPAPAPVVEIPAPAPAPAPASAPTVYAPVMGEMDIRSKRVTAGTPIDTYRICNNQRKNVIARYYIQGGYTVRDPLNGRDFFKVAVEIPHTDLHTAKLQLVTLLAELKADRADVA
jgi:hypothetical protein